MKRLFFCVFFIIATIVAQNTIVAQDTIPVKFIGKMLIEDDTLSLIGDGTIKIDSISFEINGDGIDIIRDSISSMMPDSTNTNIVVVGGDEDMPMEPAIAWYWWALIMSVIGGAGYCIIRIFQ